tara:strand:- start:33 stop:704 length:672 start_codon:yes stop_codon:yes gene_type:complete
MDKYYKILKLQPGASFQDVKRAYKTQVKLWHPDRFPQDSPRLQKKAYEMFQKVTTAYKKICTTYTSYKFREVSGWKGKSNEYSRASRKSEKTTSDSGSNSQQPESIPGFITKVWPNGDKYEGQMFQDLMHGRGIFTSSQGYIYTGDFKYGKPNGLGKLVYDNGDKYEGSFLDDRLHGQGKYSYANGDSYQGEFQNDLPHGQGVYIISNGNVYSGLWKKGGLIS